LATSFEAARERFKPRSIRFLLVAEAPPADERFFYFEKVQKSDNLFLETMRVLYVGEEAGAGQIRSQKRKLLERFMHDGFYLVDVFDHPVKSCPPTERSRRIIRVLPSLLIKLHGLVSQETPIILVSSVVYEACASGLRQAGFRVSNNNRLLFPEFGWQPQYRSELRTVLRSSGWVPQGRISL